MSAPDLGRATPAGGAPAGITARVPAPLLLGAAALSLQTGSAVATQLFGALGAPGVLALRLVTAAVVLVVLGRAWRHLPTGRALVLVVAFGAVTGSMNLCFYLALERIPLGVTVALELLGPLAVAVAGSRHRRDVLWAGVAVLGVVLLVGPTALESARGTAGARGAGLDPVGIVFALSAGTLWAGYILLGSRVSHALPGTAGLAWAMVAAGVVVLPLGVATAGTALLSPGALAAGIAVGVLSGALPYGIELVTMRRIGARAFGVMMSLEPAVALLPGFVIAGQVPSAVAVGGIALVVVASLGASVVPPAAEESEMMVP